MLDNNTNADLVDAMAMRDRLADAIRYKGDPTASVGSKVRPTHSRIIAEHLIAEGLIDLNALARAMDEPADDEEVAS
jgi:hypothetical protein